MAMPRSTPQRSTAHDRIRAAEFFAPQPTSSADLPNPEPIVRNLAHGVMEVLAGVRECEQLARWMSEDAYRALVTRANLSTRARSARGIPAARALHHVLSVRHCAPADGVVEAVVVIAGSVRTRAIALRLEGIDRRWRATSLALL